MLMERIIGAEIKSLQNMLLRQIEKQGTELGKERPSGPGLFLLKFLRDNKDKDVFQRDLEKALGTTKSTCSKVLSGMEEKGFVRRVSVADARFNKICLTPLGEEVVKIADRHMEEFEAKLRIGLTDEQLATFFACIDRMKKNLSELK